MLQSNSVFLLFLLLLFSTPQQTVASEPDEETPPLAAEPYQQSLLVGSNTTVSCHLSPELATNYSVAELAWYFPNGSQIDNWAWSHANISAVNGTMSAIHLAVEDSGDYVCSVPDRRYNASTTLQVYNMPSYLTQIAVVYAVDGVLLFIFLALGLHSLLLSRRTSISTAPDASAGKFSAAAGRQQQPHQQIRHSRQPSRAVSESAGASTGAAATAGAAADDVDDNEEALSTSLSGLKSHRHHSTLPKPSAADD
ncbi:hypothetical protein BOX15_Mlig006216g2 [Macrostomum lignano]|uniref:Ig-like domain-containing protein n=2 Tax=Macrostomum lignano TaxID=282301 RepID=A0A267GAD0_9PLAT|nr:hypothetical protein BOX15_Mlig025002g1 [Macrostomum lignano]PAA82334.1 hypothetical protein BOX15_Mlig006216g2 [Macrostomum lignano]